ncbi:MAG TPA: glycogen synthase [Steroidobacteraceae bacterium]|jgi:starch synthase|nr:glycogen synthase [Steroidobacteraceae bacterium]
MTLSVCLLSAEVAPLSKTGGLADVAGALAKYLTAAGHDVRLFTPLYASIDRARFPLQPVEGLQQVPLRIGPHHYVYSIATTRLPGSDALVHLVDCPVLYGRPAIYTTDPDEHLRFLAFTRAVLAACQRLQWSPQILHCNDWHTAFGPLFVKAQLADEPLFARTRSVLTIHNIGYQGVFSSAAVADLELGPRSYLLHQDDLRAGKINPLRHGILYADAITTVSPTHAHEICTDEYGMGLQDSLRMRSNALTGILNGVDYQVWDPRNDRYLPAHYDPDTLSIKAKLKGDFIRRLGLTVPVTTPLAGMVSRLAAQKGIELMFESLPQVLEWRELGFVALGSGEPQYERFLTELEQRFPGRVIFRQGYDEELSHWIEAACDMFLMPSLYEPCGLNQMYSLRYGTVPIVRRTGGLADSVQNYEPDTGAGTGIVFNDFDSEALEWALNIALDLHAQPKDWQRMVRNGMAKDFSWQTQGEIYVGIYRQLTG